MPRKSGQDARGPRVAPLLRQHASPLINHTPHTNIACVTVFQPNTVRRSRLPVGGFHVPQSLSGSHGCGDCRGRDGLSGFWRRCARWRKSELGQPRIAHVLGAAGDIDYAVGVAVGAYRDAAEFRQSPAELGAVAGRLLRPLRVLGWARGRLPRRGPVRAYVWPRLDGWPGRHRVIPGPHLPAWVDRARRDVPLALVPAP